MVVRYSLHLKVKVHRVGSDIHSVRIENNKLSFYFILFYFIFSYLVENKIKKTKCDTVTDHMI